MPTLPNRLRQAAQYTGLDSMRELLIEAAGALESSEPVAWRYQDARGKFRYRGYVPGFDKEYAILKPVPLYGAPQPPAPEETSSEFTDTARAALLWVLYHHQGGSSKVGQPIRSALGMGAHEHLNDHQLREAKRWGELEAKAAAPQPQERKRITDEQMEAVHEAARRSFIRHKSSIGGQQLTAADSLESHVMWATWAECCKTHGIKD